MSVWKLAANILTDVHLDRDSLHQRFTSISPSRANLTHISARKKKNANSNRYGNILPFDHNCVKVMAHAAEGSRGRYINASLMQAQAGDPAQWRYIATQGPLQHTVHDFWHMVVEQECRVIVMLTEVTEGTAAKCCQYFPPEPSSNMQEDDVTVTCVSSATLGQDGADIQKREFAVQVANNADPFRCVHYQMLTWPDHGAPEETKPIQELLEAVNAEMARTTGVPCVHCSAGVGRTGTYIVIDVILTRLRNLEGQNSSREDVELALDVESLIGHLRSQRVAMVQSIEQLEFIYMTLLASCTALAKQHGSA